MSGNWLKIFVGIANLPAFLVALFMATLQIIGLNGGALDTPVGVSWLSIAWLLSPILLVVWIVMVFRVLHNGKRALGLLLGLMPISLLMIPVCQTLPFCRTLAR